MWRWAWLVSALLLTALLVTLRFLEVAQRTEQAAGAALGILLAGGLAARSGGRSWAAIALAATLAAGALITQWEPLLAGAALATGVLAACLALLGTVPAVGLVAVVREVVLAQLLATAGALGVVALAPDVPVERFTYTVLGLTLIGTLAMVYRLGAGLHGLGGRGIVVAAFGVLLLAVALAYTEALTRYGSPELVGRAEDARNWLRAHFGGVANPLEALVGVPALAWGVAMRSRRRQGWWLCVFGAATTAPATARLLDPGSWSVELLSAVYSVVLGLLLGLLAIWVSRALIGGRGRRAAAAAAPRPEPGRFQPLH